MHTTIVVLFLHHFLTWGALAQEDIGGRISCHLERGSSTAIDYTPLQVSSLPSTASPGQMQFVLKFRELKSGRPLILKRDGFWQHKPQKTNIYFTSLELLHPELGRAEITLDTNHPMGAVIVVWSKSGDKILGKGLLRCLEFLPQYNLPLSDLISPPNM